MGNAARAIIIENDKILVMHRNKRGKEYFTLVGGLAKPNEPIEQALAREVMEETGLEITSSRFVFAEKHRQPYNDQYVFLCEVAAHDAVALQSTSEEAIMNRIDTNSHTPMWVDPKKFAKLPFITIELQKAIIDAIKNGFPNEPVQLS